MNELTEVEKEIQQMRDSDLSPAMMARARTPKKTWFFERMGDGMILACEHKEAWQICYNRSSWKRRDFRLLGTSDGKTFQRIVNESIAEAQRIEPQIEKKRAELQRYMQAEENLIMNEAVDMKGDPSDETNEKNKQKVLRFRKMMDDIHEDLDALEAEYQEKVSSVVKRATDEELKVARANQKRRLADGLEVDWPDENSNINTPDAQGKRRQKIVSIIEGRAG